MVIDEEIDLKRNVLQWYPIKENGTILQIGFESYEVIDEMCKKAEDVTLIVNSEEQKEEILKYYDKEKETTEEKIRDKNERISIKHNRKYNKYVKRENKKRL